MKFMSLAQCRAQEDKALSEGRPLRIGIAPNALEYLNEMETAEERMDYLRRMIYRETDVEIEYLVKVDGRWLTYDPSEEVKS